MSEKTEGPVTSGPLQGVKVVDMTRILAGPTCTQLFGDLGADVIKIERPGGGDDTRSWGPPFLEPTDPENRGQSAYFLANNRNKRSVAIDFGKPEGVALIKRLMAESDIFIHNMKAGGLDKYGLGYDHVKNEFPSLIYCAISGFGQTGPYAKRPGYDALAQAMGGLMSITGEPDGPPTKVGVGIADMMCGMYASNAILAALRHRDKTGEGQMIDVALLDTQVAWLVNEALNYFVSGNVPHRIGTQHPNVVPYEVFPTKDGYFYLAAGNDRQFASFCELAGLDDLPKDDRYATNAARLAHRDEVRALIREATPKKTTAEWVEGLNRLNVPASPVHTIEETFQDPQVMHREMSITMSYDGTPEGHVRLLGNPIKMTATPPTYRRPPPDLGQHTDEVLEGELGLSADDLAALKDAGVIG